MEAAEPSQLDYKYYELSLSNSQITPFLVICIDITSLQYSDSNGGLSDPLICVSDFVLILEASSSVSVPQKKITTPPFHCIQI